MATDSSTPLTPDQYAVGREVKHQDQTVTVRGALVGDHGSRFLLVSQGDSVVSGLVDESLVRDEFDAVEPRDPNAEPPATTTTEGQDTTPPAESQNTTAPGTGGTDGTGGA